MREVGERGEVGKGHLVEFWWQIRGLYTWGKGPAPLFVCGHYGVYLLL